MDIRALQKIFAERLAGLMQEKSLNKTMLADKTGISRTTIGNWLLLKRTPQIDSLYILSEFFGCTIDYLLGKKDS